MAINLIFIDFIVPIAKIRALYPGGWEKCLYDHRRSLGGKVYFDQHLFHTGAMDPEDGEKLIEHWTKLGFEATEVIDGKKVWKDFCALESLLVPERGPWWLRINHEERAAYLTGTEPGSVAGRRLFLERRKTKQDKAAFRSHCRRMRWAAVLMYLTKDCIWSLTGRLNQWMLHELIWQPIKLVR